MLWRKTVSLLVMTVAVSSQMANAEISVRAPMRSASAALKSDAQVNGGYINSNATQAGLPVGSSIGNEFLPRDAGLRSIASNYIYATHTADAMDTWLMVLVGGGLVVLQLRRKQKSLPQRPVIESENKLFWG